jgi:hypothetical protein
MGASSVAKEDCTTIRGGGGARDTVATNVMVPAQANPWTDWIRAKAEFAPAVFVEDEGAGKKGSLRNDDY